ncbi:MAG: hypothetical protein JNM56_14915 [Planctomycetia bacterium]|nr:hypothetical protein [Planctomycetia bacterium]
MPALTEQLVADTLDAVRWMLARQSPVGETFGEQVAGYVREGLTSVEPARLGPRQRWRRMAGQSRTHWCRRRGFGGGRGPIE